MKAIVLIIFVFYTSHLIAQYQSIDKVEIFMMTENVPSDSTFEYYLDPMSTILTHPYGDISNWTICTVCDDPAVEIIEGNHNSWGRGWDISYDVSLGSPFDVYGYGLYKFSSNRSGSSVHFYLDFRDRYYVGNILYSGTPDFVIKYDYSSDSYLYQRTGANATFIPIASGDFLQIWVIKEATHIPDTSPFSEYNYWESCLGIIKNNHPKIVWGPHPTMNPISGYKIYRAVHSNPVNPALRNYQLAAATNNSTFSWIDTDVNLNSTISYIYYIVKAYYQTTLSTATNSVGAYGQYNPSKQASKVDENIVLSLSNYPNPFNPETTISYSIPKSSLVNITVNDLLGRRIAELTNEKKEAGSYEVNFNAENLPSGLYIYKLTTNEKIVIKKMMLLR
ncbi:MAG: T9SS type A sorting domain-containing protein [Melioribacteraceae bacterium]|nr:T9SS type A sorting domain-containing protein [Melioribacteraceae bacterium]